MNAPLPDHIWISDPLAAKWPTDRFYKSSGTYYDWENEGYSHYVNAELWRRDVSSALQDNSQLTMNIHAHLKEIAQLHSECNGAAIKFAEILAYCRGQTEFMWAAEIVGIILECDFRESGEKIKGPQGPPKTKD